MARTVNRSARTGRFVPKAQVRRSPRTTTTEAVGRGTGNTKAVHRSAITGRFVTKATAQRRPSTTIRQEV